MEFIVTFLLGEKEKIDIAMKAGANDPDEKFKDFEKHHFSPAFYEAKWLAEGKKAWDKKEYTYASYCFGVASHYITDSFCAPHYITGELNEDHKAYETQTLNYTPKITYIRGNLYTLTSMGPYTADKWQLWLKNRDPRIPRADLDIGTSVAYSMIKDAIEDKIRYYPTEISNTTSSTKSQNMTQSMSHPPPRQPYHQRKQERPSLP